LDVHLICRDSGKKCKKRLSSGGNFLPDWQVFYGRNEPVNGMPGRALTGGGRNGFLPLGVAGIREAGFANRFQSIFHRFSSATSAVMSSPRQIRRCVQGSASPAQKSASGEIPKTRKAAAAIYKLPVQM
jgi:hypothetical protein